MITADLAATNTDKEQTDNTTAKFINDVMIVALDERQSDNAQNEIVEDMPSSEQIEYTAKDGEDYTADNSKAGYSVSSTFKNVRRIT